MILYHGSYMEISKPDVVHSRPRVDFGQGFYVTPIYEQAEKWCQRFQRGGKEGVISRYTFDEKTMNDGGDWNLILTRKNGWILC